MFRSDAEVVTDQPERYVKQLVSHLSHRLATSVSADGVGLIEVDGGRCILTPGPVGLVLRAVADDDAAMLRIQDVVGRHLERFGARAGLRVVWSAVSHGSAAGAEAPPPSG